MKASARWAIAICTVGAALVACSDLTTDGANTVALSEAFETVPAGFSANSNSFDPIADEGLPFFPGMMGGQASFDRGSNSGPGTAGSGRRDGEDAEHEDDDHHDGFGKRVRGLLMGGGLGPHFIGAIAFGRGIGDGPFHIFDLPSSCAFDATSGRVNCPDRVNDRGFTVKKSFAFKDAAGAAQPKFDSATTDLINAKIDVSGTKIRHDDDDDEHEDAEDDDADDAVKATVHHASDFTVEGLSPGKTERKVNGTAEAHEEINGRRHGTNFTAVRDADDKVTDVIIPITDDRPTIPSSGSVLRHMKVTITPEGGAAKTKERTEEITFDGTNVISVKITQDGVTKNCTITLPRKKLVCE
ncbi:MAG TPA: hypothetical protein VFT29_09235 [Gemmatimonadaceae bacterium]|nr:hypothetical protein [Gemmatimonadaceae bacterium]